MQNPELDEAPRMVVCPECEGIGIDDNCHYCSVCNGWGRIEVDSQAALEDAAEAKREARTGR